MLATVAAGLYISWNGLRLISAATRLQGVFFWDFLDLPDRGHGVPHHRPAGAHAHLRHRRLFDFELAMAAAVVSVVVIVTRFIWVYPAAYLPRWLVPAVRRRDPCRPGNGRSRWRSPESVASFRSRRRLRFPFAIADGSPFPGPRPDPVSDLLRDHRDPGRRRPDAARGDARAGSRPYADGGSGTKSRIEEFRARRRAIEAAIERLDRLTTERQAPESVVRPIRVAQSDRLKLVEHRNDGDARHKKLVDLGDEIEFSLIEAERDFINDLYRDGELKDEAAPAYRTRTRSARRESGQSAFDRMSRSEPAAPWVIPRRRRLSEPRLSDGICGRSCHARGTRA